MADDHRALGEFLRTRRERLSPGVVGIPGSSRRRTPGLRREEVALLAHISTEYYTRLEQGRAPHPSPQIITELARALRLSAGETSHLAHLAGTVPAIRTEHERTVRPSILTLLERLPDTAAIVVSAAFDVLAWNDLAAALLVDFAEVTAEGRSLARRAFLTTDARESLFGVSDVDEFRVHVARELRTSLARYPNDPHLRTLISDLHASPIFFHLWSAHDVDAPPMLSKTFHHPVVGEIEVDCNTLVDQDADYRVVLYSAAPGTDAATTLSLLRVLSADT